MKKIIMWLGLSVVAFNLFSADDSGVRNLHRNASPFNILLQACLKGDLNQAASIIPYVKNLNKQMNDKKTMFVKTQLIKVYGVDAHSEIEHKMTPLILASSRGHKDIVKLLLEYGVDVNIQTKQGVSALMLAVEGGHKKIVELLLQHNANPNLQEKNGFTALMIATCKGYKKIVEFLLIHKADPDIQGVMKYSALIAAAQEGHEEIVELLLRHNANPHLQRDNGCTALIAASYTGCKKIVELLLKYYANPNIQGKQGETALIVALFLDAKNRKQEEDVIETIECLLEYDADTELKLTRRSYTINDVLNNSDGTYKLGVKNESIKKLKLRIQSTYALQKEGVKTALIKYPHLKELLIKRMLKQGAQLYTNKVAQEAFSSELIDDKELRYKEGLEYIHNNYLSDLGNIYKNDYFKKQAVSQNCFQKYTAREYYFNNLKKMNNSGMFSDLTILARDN